VNTGIVTFKGICCECMDGIRSELGSKMDSCENANKSSGSMRCGALSAV
jgi:hypothetical protein